MSKRRKREAGFEVKEKTEEKERPKKEKVSEARVVKPGEVSTKKIMVYSIVVAAIFFGAGLFASPAITGYSIAEPGTTNDQLIFISSSGCTNCEELEPLVKEVADTLGVSFTKTGFSQQLENPGFVLVYNDNFLGVTGFDSELSLKQQICQLTQNDKICTEANELAPKTTVGNFMETNEPVCKEDGKPVIYFFGSEGCGHCRWEHPVVERVAGKFEGYISFHNNMNSDADMDVFSRYSTGGIPTIVLGCKYFRQGSGERAGEEAEEKALTQLICGLTNNQPADLCSQF